MKLKRLNWSERNYRALVELLNGVQPGEIAVFDWDNTCAYNDIGEALLRRMAFGLEFRMDAAAMAASIPDRIHGIGRVNLGNKDHSLSRMKKAIFSALDRLQRRPFAIRNRDTDKDFRIFTSGLLALNRALEETPGIGCEFAYPWVNTLLRGWSMAEFDRLAEEVIARALQEPLRRHAILDPGGRWRYDWTGGIRLYPEMMDLAACWRQRGGRLVVSTASNRQLVEKAIAMTGFPCREVIGMELALAGRRFRGALQPGWRPNLGAGKVHNLISRLGREPVFVAGDSSNDVEMLTAFAATRARLVVDHRAAGKIRSLVRRARAGETGFLRQAIDPGRGAFRAARRG